MPQSELSAGAVGSFLGKQVASAIVSQAAKQFVLPAVFDALGISEADDGAKYAEIVMAEMRRIGEDLKRQIDLVQESVNRVAALTIDIQVYQQQEGLAQILRTFNTEATKIETLFKLFTNDVRSLSANDETKNKRALKDLYTRLTSPNDRDVSTAMKNIHNLIIPPTSGDRGIPDYLADIVGQAVFKAAPGMMKPVPNAKTNWRTEYTLPSDVDYVPATQIITESPAAVNAELETVRSVFLRILAAQTKGLIFLTRAWTDGPQEQGLQEHIDDIVAEIAAMKGFFARCVPAIETSIAKSVQQFGKPLTGEITRIPWLGLRTLHNQRLWTDVPEGLNARWIVWQVYAYNGRINSVHVAEEPWLRKPSMRGIAHVSVRGFRDESASYVDGQTYDFPRVGGMDDYGFISQIRYPGTVPEALKTMLATLPATRKELNDAVAAAP